MRFGSNKIASENGGVLGVVAKTGRGIVAVIVVVVVVVVTGAATLAQILFLPELTHEYLTPFTVLVELNFVHFADALTPPVRGANERSVNERVRATVLVIFNDADDSANLLNWTNCRLLKRYDAVSSASSESCWLPGITRLAS